MADFYDILRRQIKKDDFYAILGCDELATSDQINAEFRQKAKKLHPDKNPDDEATAKLFERSVWFGAYFKSLHVISIFLDKFWLNFRTIPYFIMHVVSIYAVLCLPTRKQQIKKA